MRKTNLAICILLHTFTLYFTLFYYNYATILLQFTPQSHVLFSFTWIIIIVYCVFKYNQLGCLSNFNLNYFKLTLK